jgi:hypothetical protein
MTFVSKICTMPAMAVADRIETQPAVRSKCHGDQHHFMRNAPPGSNCDCGKKVRLYEPCISCGQPTATTSDIKSLEEDYR